MKRAVAGLAILVWMTMLAGVVLAATRTVHVGYNVTYYFEDATVGDGVVEAKTGDRLSFVFDDSGTGGKRHSAVVTELGIDSGPQPKGATWTSAVLTTPGTYRLFCRFHQAAPNNHWTTLIVTGAALTPPPAVTPKPTVAPTSTPRSTASPAPSKATSSASPGASTGASAAASTPGASAPSGSPSDSAAPGDSAAIDDSSASPGPDASTDTGLDGSAVGNGPGGPSPTTWLRSVQVGLLAILPILAAGWVAFVLSKRRRRPPS